jgi:hypothetical protein
LALNPDAFEGRSDMEILSTLVHEMCHCWQEAFGKPSRRGYHNREWADKMIAIGLMPSDTGEPDGRQTGQRVTHYILDEGPFAQAATALLRDGYRLHWQSSGRARPGHQSKLKYSCPVCGQNVWGKPGVLVYCAACHTSTCALHLLT